MGAEAAEALLAPSDAALRSAQHSSSYVRSGMCQFAAIAIPDQV
jgi:hypothetical protein